MFNLLLHYLGIKSIDANDIYKLMNTKNCDSLFGDTSFFDIHKYPEDMYITIYKSLLKQ